MGELVSKSSEELLTLPNFGEQSLAEVRQALWKRNMWLADGPWPNLATWMTPDTTFQLLPVASNVPSKSPADIGR